LLSFSCLSGQEFGIISNGSGSANFSGLGCRDYPRENLKFGNLKCGLNETFQLIKIEFLADKVSKVVFETCFDPSTLRSVWAKNVIYNEIANRETGSSEMPSSFNPDDFFSDFDVNKAYYKVQQRDALADILGSIDLANKYINVEKGELYMSRGHLAPKADFIYTSWQRSTYRYINAAPQWQSFNGGNWNSLESAVRSIFELIQFSIPYVEVYTGTHGVLELKDVNNNPTEIWFSGGAPDKRLPVPKFYWKVVYEPSTKLGVALIGINNPHMTTEEIPSYKICQEIPSHPLISNLVAPEDIYKGVCYACSVPDARAAILDIPFLEISGILGVNDSSAVSLNISLLLLSFCIFSFI